LLNWDYHKVDWAQAIVLTHIAWGAIFAWLFGFSFTTLALANLTMSLFCLLVFYSLLRQLNITPFWALLGVALLGFNPIYVYISYSFMTEITFLTLTLLACICFIRGVQTGKSSFLLLAGACIGLAYLTRQFAVVLVIAALFYLWWSARWTWARAIAIVALPIAVVITYGIWERTQPATLGEEFSVSMLQTILSAPWEVLSDRTQRITSALAVWGITFAPLLIRPKRFILTLPIFFVLALGLVSIASALGTVFPQDGSVVDHTGLLMFEYSAKGLWPQSVWILIAVAGAFVLSLYLAAAAEWLHNWFNSSFIQRNRGRDPQVFLTITAILMAGAALALPPVFFDRYLLPSVALLIPMALKSAQGEAASEVHHPNRVQLQLRWLIIVPLVVFTLCAQADYMSHANARWQAAEALAAQGVPRNQIKAGFEWAGWYLYEEGAQLIREGAPFQFPGYVTLDAHYLITDLPEDGWIESTTVPYTSLLTGGETRHVLILTKK
jgi:4-amino-4-deoxy-L-arabinose transferase-like glycosyltransferase